MDRVQPPPPDPELRDRLRQLEEEVDRSYAQLTAVASRLLSVNEASDRLASSHDREGLGAILLEVSALAAGARTGAVFESRGEGAFALLASLGVSEEEAEELAGSLPDLAACALVEDEAATRTIEELEEAESFRQWQEEQRAEDPEAPVEPSFAIFVPIQVEDSLLGVLALGPRDRGQPYDEERRILLEHLAGQGAMALDRAQLMAQNEDRLRDLDALLRISRELTSTLDLDRVLLTAVNTTAAIVERERAVLALFEGGRLVVRAVSDFPRVDSGTAERLGLEKLLQWLSLRPQEMLLVNASQVEEDESLEGREVLRDYFSGDMRGLLAIGLKDDQGPVGYLLLETYHEDAFRQEADREALTVLAGQLAVSIRNAELYRQMPMVSALAPLAARRRKWQQMTPGQRRRFVAVAALLFVAVALVPWPRSVAGDARVLPGIEVPVRVRADGVLRLVAIRSGDAVEAGQFLGQMDPVPSGARMAELRALALEARGEAAAAEAGRDPVERRLADLRREQAVARLAALHHEAGRIELVAPVAGTVLTPLVEQRVGDWFEMGDVFCQVSPLDTLHVEVAIDEVDVHRIRPGSKLRLKVLAYPDRQFQGRVTTVSWVGEAARPGERSHFLLRGWVDNPGPHLRAGMTGRARIEAGSATLLWRVTRDLVRGLRLRFWV